MSLQNKKSLGQHWLSDRSVLSEIANFADIGPDDVILEIGPGLGTLTSELLRPAKKVVAVEFDPALAGKLPGQFPGKNLEVIHGDILDFDLSTLPTDYKVVANVPYYITSKIVKKLMTADNKPKTTVLLVQQEVAQRLAAKPGKMSILSVSAQVYADVELGIKVPARLFTPPPKVDSQVVVLKTRKVSFFTDIPEKDFFRVVKAGFSSKRKKLRSSLSGGLGMSKNDVEILLKKVGIDPNSRAESIDLSKWSELTGLLLEK